MINGEVSFWQAVARAARWSAPASPGSRDVDVCIVGAGYTGLWTAWALAGADPGLRIAVRRGRSTPASAPAAATAAGCPASCRAAGSGWPASPPPARAAAGPAWWRFSVTSTTPSPRSSRSAHREGIDADIHLGGTLAVATTAAQLARLRAAVAEDRAVGPRRRRRVGAERRRSSRAGWRWPELSGACSARTAPVIHPAKLVRGLAVAVERRGVAIYERTPALAVEPGRVRTAAGRRAAAPWVVLATEGFTATLPGLPAPAPADEQLHDRHRAPSPGRRGSASAGPAWKPGATPPTCTPTPSAPPMTASPSAAGACRTASGHALRPAAALLARTAARTGRHLAAPAAGRRPDTRGPRLERRARCGPGLVPRYRRDPARRGRVGLGRRVCRRRGRHARTWPGRTLADLVLGRDTDLTVLPWVGHTSRAWEPEPLRWLGVRSMYALYRAADRAEARQPGRSRERRAWARLADLVSGRP